tara:strand:+ start:530 stop:700 length:171 start_codon:yes stop_codon:yes gene_type:complete
MTYTIEHYQYQLVNDDLVQTWSPFESFEDQELAEKELSNLQRRWSSAEFRLTHSPD